MTIMEMHSVTGQQELNLPLVTLKLKFGGKEEDCTLVSLYMTQRSSVIPTININPSMIILTIF